MRPHWSLAVPAAVSALFLLALSGLLFAQEPRQDWEGKGIEGVTPEGFVREIPSSHLNVAGLRRGIKLTREVYDRAHKELWKSHKFEDVQITVKPDPTDPAKVRVTVRVREHPVVEEIRFPESPAIPITQLKLDLRTLPGQVLNPYHLQLDRERIRAEYLGKGYHFSEVSDRLLDRPGPNGVILQWDIVEGPLVSVEEIIFTGNDTLSRSEIENRLVTKQNGTFFGLCTTTKAPFVEKNLREDIKRIQLLYSAEGWLDMSHGERVFLRDLTFNEDKSRVTIHIHVNEGTRYRIRDIKFVFDASSRRLFTDEEMLGWLLSKKGESYSQFNATRDVGRIRDHYGEKAYILVEISDDIIVPLEGHELDLVFTLKENEKQYVGRVIFEGNSKTRENVLRREFTRYECLPGEEFNNRNLTRSISRIRQRQLIDPIGEGITYRTQEGDLPNSRDIVVSVNEGKTGNIKIAAGYNSTFGLLGIFEFTQKNFDIADLPSSFEDMFVGTGFAGAGQFFQIRLAPGARQQLYSVEFREPYFFGFEYELGLRAYSIETERESYDDSRYGGKISLEKRFDPFAVRISFNGYELELEDVEATAPLGVLELEGRNTSFSLTPAVIFDTRDSFIFPTEGVRILLSYEYVGQVLAGDFDFNRYTIDVEGHLPILTLDSKMRHVLSVQGVFERIHEARDMRDIPIVERRYAGGRDSIRGFEFRGMGPHEQGDPIGGEAYAFGSIEYSLPIYGMDVPEGGRKLDILRLAFFYDVAALAPSGDDLKHEKFRNTVGFGLRFMIPQLGGIPVKLDFGFPQTKRDDDERQTVTFDIGTFF